MTRKEPETTVIEHTKRTQDGVVMLLVWIGLIIASLFGVIVGAASDNPLTVIGSVLALVFSIIMLAGVFTVQPNQAVALLLFGKYVGTTRANGLRWANPFYSKKKVSLRVRNFETDKLKVNELDGSPIEIAAVVVWQVVDSAEALFAVDDYVNFVHIQSEAALRQMATAYPYDGSTPEEIALRSHANEISERLMAEIQDRLEAAGVKVIETRISHLAYAAEIASAMLQRQQATAVVAAREKIVEGAVGMVEHALAQLSEREILELDPERRANMVSNLLVVLCGDRNAQPVLNTGTLY